MTKVKALIASGDFRLAEEAARRAGIDVSTINYLRNILNQDSTKEKKQEAAKATPPTPPVPLKETITSVKEQAEKLRQLR